jgi:protein-disulfide isomerase
MASGKQDTKQGGTGRSERLWQVGAALVLALAVVIIAVAISSSGSKKKAAPPTIFNGIPQQGITLGEPTAPVSMIEFADLQCPVCREYTVSALPDIVSRYVRTGKLRLVFRGLGAIGPDSARAARAAYAAGEQNKLWQFVDVFYADQGEENSGYVTDAFIRKVAQKVPGLDVNKLMLHRNDPFTKPLLDDAKRKAKALNVKAVPTFFLQRGSSPALKKMDVTELTIDGFKPAIDAAIAGK